MNKKNVKNWMYENYQSFLDQSNCLNITELAESACDHFNDYKGYNPQSGCYDIPEEYFEISADVQCILQEQNIINW